MKQYRGGELREYHKKFVLTGEYRTPKRGEYYLSGATPEAWRAPNDLSTEFYIVGEQGGGG